MAALGELGLLVLKQVVVLEQLVHWKPSRVVYEPVQRVEEDQRFSRLPKRP